jgi:hypothetical protein
MESQNLHTKKFALIDMMNLDFKGSLSVDRASRTILALAYIIQGYGNFPIAYWRFLSGEVAEVIKAR